MYIFENGNRFYHIICTQILTAHLWLPDFYKTLKHFFNTTIFLDVIYLDSIAKSINSTFVIRLNFDFDNFSDPYCKIFKQNFLY